MAAKGQTATLRRSFQAALERDTSGLGWTVARVPFEPAAVWPAMVRLRVRGEIAGAGQGNGHGSGGGGFAFRSSLFPVAESQTSGGGYCLLVNRRMQEGAGVTLGGVAGFLLEPDLEPRPAELPDELAVLLDDEPELRGWYDELTEYMRRELGKWVLGAKSDEARMRRARQTAERLLSAREAERELSPLIARAMRARPKAQAGWKRMTSAQRRTELMAVFHYQTPEAREKRVGKLVETAEKKGG